MPDRDPVSNGGRASWDILCAGLQRACLLKGIELCFLELGARGNAVPLGTAWRAMLMAAEESSTAQDCGIILSGGT